MYDPSDLDLAQTTAQRAQILDGLRQGYRLSPEERESLDRPWTITPKKGEFSKALSRGTASIPALAEGFVGQIAEPFAPEFAQKRLSSAVQQLARAQQQNPPTYTSFDEARANGLRGLGTYAQSAIGEMIPTAALTTAAALLSRGATLRASPTTKNVASFLGGTAAGAPLEGGETALELYSDPEAMMNTTPEQRRNLTAARAVGGGALEALVPAGLFTNKLASLGRNTRPGLGAALQNIGVTAGTSALGEGATEGAQNLLGQRIMQEAVPGRELDLAQAREAAIRGAFGGGALGASVGAVDSGLATLAGAIPERSDVAPEISDLRMLTAIAKRNGRKFYRDLKDITASAESVIRDRNQKTNVDLRKEREDFTKYLNETNPAVLDWVRTAFKTPEKQNEVLNRLIYLRDNAAYTSDRSKEKQARLAQQWQEATGTDLYSVLEGARMDKDKELKNFVNYLDETDPAIMDWLRTTYEDPADQNAALNQLIMLRDNPAYLDNRSDPEVFSKRDQEYINRLTQQWQEATGTDLYSVLEGARINKNVEEGAFKEDAKDPKSLYGDSAFSGVDDIENLMPQERLLSIREKAERNTPFESLDVIQGALAANNLRSNPRYNVPVRFTSDQLKPSQIAALIGRREDIKKDGRWTPSFGLMFSKDELEKFDEEGAFETELNTMSLNAVIGRPETRGAFFDFVSDFDNSSQTKTARKISGERVLNALAALGYGGVKIDPAALADPKYLKNQIIEGVKREYGIDRETFLDLVNDIQNIDYTSDETTSLPALPQRLKLLDSVLKEYGLDRATFSAIAERFDNAEANSSQYVLNRAGLKPTDPPVFIRADLDLSKVNKNTVVRKGQDGKPITVGELTRLRKPDSSKDELADLVQAYKDNYVTRDDLESIQEIANEAIFNDVENIQDLVDPEYFENQFLEEIESEYGIDREAFLDLVDDFYSDLDETNLQLDRDLEKYGLDRETLNDLVGELEDAGDAAVNNSALELIEDLGLNTDPAKLLETVNSFLSEDNPYGIDAIDRDRDDFADSISKAGSPIEGADRTSQADFESFIKDAPGVVSTETLASVNRNKADTRKKYLLSLIDRLTENTHPSDIMTLQKLIEESKFVPEPVLESVLKDFHESLEIIDHPYLRKTPANNIAGQRWVIDSKLYFSKAIARLKENTNPKDIMALQKQIEESQSVPESVLRYFHQTLEKINPSYLYKRPANNAVGQRWFINSAQAQGKKFSRLGSKFSRLNEQKSQTRNRRVKQNQEALENPFSNAMTEDESFERMAQEETSRQEVEQAETERDKLADSFAKKISSGELFTKNRTILARAVNNWSKKYLGGLKVNILEINTDDDKEAAAYMMAKYSNGVAIRGLAVYGERSNLPGITGPTIILNNFGSKKFKRAKFSKLATLAHEFGHLIQQYELNENPKALTKLRKAHAKAVLDKFKNGDLRAAYRGAASALRFFISEKALNDLEKILEELESSTDAEKEKHLIAYVDKIIADVQGKGSENYVLSFEEFFAEQFSRYALGDPSVFAQEDKGVRKTLDAILKKLKRFYEEIYLKFSTVQPEFEEYIQSLSKAYGEKAAKETATNKIKSENRENERAARNRTETEQKFVDVVEKIFGKGKLKFEFNENLASGVNAVFSARQGEQLEDAKKARAVLFEQRREVLLDKKKAKPELEDHDAIIESIMAEIEEYNQNIAVVGTLRIAAGADMMTGLAAHEVMHPVMQTLLTAQERKNLAMAFTRGLPGRQLRKYFEDSPEVLDLIDPNSKNFDEEEAVAYGFQLYFANPGAIKFGEKPRTIFEKLDRFYKEILGILTYEDKAKIILNDLASGRRAERGTPLQEKLDEEGTLTTNLREIARTVAQAVESLHNLAFRGVYNTLIAAENPALERIANAGYVPTGKTGEGYIQAKRRKETEYMNRLEALFSGLTDEELTELHEAKIFALRPENEKLGKAYDELTKFLKDMYDYQQEAGANFIGREEYYPLTWDPEKVRDNAEEFMALLNDPEYAEYVTELKKTPQEIYESIVEYLDRGEDLVNVMGSNEEPVTAHTKRRTLNFIPLEKRRQFMADSPIQGMMDYVKQATRQAEFVRVFGRNGSRLTALKAEAVSKYGATTSELKVVDEFIDGLLGNKEVGMSRDLKDFYGAVATYQQIRLLPLALFSSLVDPLGVAVRTDSAASAWETFKYSLKNIFRDYKKEYTPDQFEVIAQDLGIISVDGSAFVDAKYTGITLRGKTKEISDKFFKYNLLNGWVRNNHIMATKHAMVYLRRLSEDFFGDEKSARFKKELNIENEDIVYLESKDRIALYADEFIEAGFDEQTAVQMEEKMKATLHKIVRESLIQPNSAEMPAWMSNPYLAPITMLKSFVFGFNAIITDRIINEAREGNYSPLYYAAAYVPGMIAADFLKDLVGNGGEEPEYKKDWGVHDYLWHGTQRSGLLGVNQFFLDAKQDVTRGGYGVESLLGPSAEQARDFVRAVNGKDDTQLYNWAVDALPMNPLYDQWLQ